MSDSLQKAIIGAIAGTIIGWSGSALRLDGRVAAIEASQQRIEKRLDQLVDAVEAHK